MKKLITAILAVCMLFCGALVTTASAVTPEVPIEASFIGFEPFASEHIRNWSPLLSRTSYGANITLTGSFSGTVVVELHNTTRMIDSFSHSFTNRTTVLATTSRTTAPGTYKIVIRVTINNVTTVRESSFINI
jgi:hypothetical protein